MQAVYILNNRILLVVVVATCQVGHLYTCEGDRLADRAPGYVRHANALRIICLGDRATRIKNHQIY